MKFNLMAVITALLISGISCEPPKERNKLPGYSKAPVVEAMGRPKMPSLNNGDASGNCFSQAPLPFEAVSPTNGIAVSNADEFIDGSVRSCINISLPDASQDEHLLEMFESLKALAIPTLLNLSMQSRNAVVVDFRNNPTAQYKRTDYELSGPGFTIPLVVKWDVASSGRLMNLLTKAKEISGIEISKTAEEYNF